MQQKRAAFTLVELLVVIGMITLLAALLLPGLGKAKARAAGVKCVANNRQLMMAWQMYTDDNNGHLLLASNPANEPLLRAPVWVAGALDFDPANRSNWDINEDIAKSPLWPYCRSPEIWKCPADSSGVRVNGRFYARVRTMAMNWWVGGWPDQNPDSAWLGAGFRGYLNLVDFVDPGPAQTWLLMDQREDSINYGSYGVDMHGWPNQPEQRRFAEDFPASYHHRAGGLAFVDGHAEIHRWRDERTMPPLRKNLNWAIGRIFLSPNNPDIFWLQERTTRKR